MALIKQFSVDAHTQIYFWHTVESLNKLTKGIQLPDDSKERFERMKKDSMKRNFLAVRQLLKKIGYSAEDLYYNSSGKPFLKGDKGISVTHSGDCVAVIISDEETVGIDIERKGERVLKIAHKYTSWEVDKSSMSDENTILKLIKIWTAKEALYKAHNKSGISLKEQIHIRNFFPTDRKTSGRVVEEEKTTYYDIEFIELENDFQDYVIAYCLKK